MGHTLSDEGRKVYYYLVIIYKVGNKEYKEYKVTSQVGYFDGKLFDKNS